MQLHHLEIIVVHAFKEGGEFGITVVPHIKIRETFGQEIAHAGQDDGLVLAVVLNQQLGNGLLDLINACDGLLVLNHSGFRRVIGRNDLQQLEGITGSPEWLGGFLLADSHYKHPGLPEALGKLGKVRITGYQAETVHIAGIEDVHGIDDHGGIRGILSGGVAVLLDGVHGPVQ